MKNKRPDDFDFELHMELTGKPNKKKLEDTLDFYKENLPLNAVEKLMSESKVNDVEIKNESDFKSSYSKFISVYNENDNKSRVAEKKNNKKEAKKQKKYERTNAASEFLNDIKDKHEAFDYDYTRPKSSLGKIFIASLFIIFLCIIAALIFKIDSLNQQIADIKMQAEDNSQAKEKLQETLIENENMKKMIEDLSNNQTTVTNENENEKKNVTETVEQKNNEVVTSEKEYIVQKGDTLSSISQKFYGSTNLYNKIVDRNKLKSENLSENQKLIIPQK